MPGWSGAEPRDWSDEPKKEKPQHSHAARMWLRWIWAGLGMFAVAVVMLGVAIWLPYPWAGNLMLTAVVVMVMSIPGWIVATSLWGRVPTQDEAWCTSLGLGKEVD